MEEDQSKCCNLIAVYWTQKTYFYYDIVPFNIILIVLTNTDCCQLTVPKWFLFSQRLWIRDWTPNCWPNSCSSCNKFYGKPGSQQCCRLNRFFFPMQRIKSGSKIRLQHKYYYYNSFCSNCTIQHWFHSA